MTDLSPREIVSELDRFIIGQKDAKRAVAIALRNRWRRLRLEGMMREEVLPKNILMIGPTGCGKTEIARRLARLANAPFLKVEATKFTEVGYVGRDVEQIVRDLVEIGISLVKETSGKMSRRARSLRPKNGSSRLSSAPTPARPRAIPSAKNCGPGNGGQGNRGRDRLSPGTSMPMFDLPNMPGASIGAISLGDIFGKSARPKQQRLQVKDAYAPLQAEESEKLLDQELIVRLAIREVENNGIVFLDEIDKICARDGRSGDVSREGVQRDLLPLIEGTTVATKHGAVKTDHILFIASGAFHVAKPSDLLPELQGRLPIRVELSSLDEEDFRRILTQPEASLVKQYRALLLTEGVNLSFTDDAIDALARVAVQVNASVENIGARRLQTVMERVLDDVSFAAGEQSGQEVTIDGAYVESRVGDLAQRRSEPLYIVSAWRQ